MSLEKAVWHKKEHRKQYRIKAKLCCWACRNHGSCSYCRDTRTFFDKKRRKAADIDIKYFINNYLDEIKQTSMKNFIVID